jgi:hypothetical protein
MITILVDTEATKQGFAEYLANTHGGTAFNAKVEFDTGDLEEDWENYRKATDEIMDCQVYGFSGQPYTIDRAPSLCVNDLNLSEDGYYELCRYAANNSFLCLTVGTISAQIEAIMRIHRAVLRFVQNIEHQEAIENLKNDLRNA